MLELPKRPPGGARVEELPSLPNNPEAVAGFLDANKPELLLAPNNPSAGLVEELPNGEPEVPAALFRSPNRPVEAEGPLKDEDLPNAIPR